MGWGVGVGTRRVKCRAVLPEDQIPGLGCVSGMGGLGVV